MGGDVLRDVYRGKSVLVTGHTGFKGGWLSLWLAELGARVTGFALDPEDGTLFRAVEPCFGADLRGDIRIREKIGEAVRESRPDYVFHLAAQPIVQRSYREPLETMETNVLGTAYLLEAVRKHAPGCHCVVVTSDKCYENRGWEYAYRESDTLGGHDVYSASKAATELVASAWMRSFFESEEVPGRVATARGGNVIGGGDFAENRIMPDAMRALSRGEAIGVRNPKSTRPWQHVLDCLGGYLALGAWLGSPEAGGRRGDRAFNFGPGQAAERTVGELVKEVLVHWPGSWCDQSLPGAGHEAHQLRIAIDKASSLLGWKPTWDFGKAVAQTVGWYRAWAGGEGSVGLLDLMRGQIAEFLRDGEGRA